MAELLDTTLEVPYDTELKCPVCEDRIAVVALVKMKSGLVRKAGQSGFRQPILTVNFDSDAVGIRIHHECVVSKSKEV